MKTTQLLCACVGLAAATPFVANRGAGDDKQDVATGFTHPGSEQDCSPSLKPVLTAPLSGEETCTAFRALEWLAYGLIEPTESFTSAAGTRIFVKPSEQSGPMTLVMRGMMIWTDILNDLAKQLEGTPSWSTETQLHVANCYLDYAFQTAVFLQVLGDQACDFGKHDPARCLMSEKIEALYIAYVNVAVLLYGGNCDTFIDVQELITGFFPGVIPESWTARCGKPHPGELIREFIAENDGPISVKEGLFPDTQKDWVCGDFYPTPERPFCDSCKNGTATATESCKHCETATVTKTTSSEPTDPPAV